MDHDAEFVALEVDAEITDAEAVHDPPGALQLAEVLQLGAHDFLGQAPEFAQDVELQVLGHFGEFSRAGRIENDLKRSHAPP